jgi:hypothetical protein
MREGEAPCPDANATDDTTEEMSHASLRQWRVALYSYRELTDEVTGITSSVYEREWSPDRDGLWWASRGIVFGREASPTPNPQEETLAFWSLSAYAPISADGLIVMGTWTRAAGFVRSQVYRVQSVMERNYARGAVQAYAVAVDDANVSFDLNEPGYYS